MADQAPPDSPEDLRHQEELRAWTKRLKMSQITPHMARHMAPIESPTEIDPGVPRSSMEGQEYDEEFAAAASRGEAPGQPDFAKPDASVKQDKKITVMLDHELWLGLKHQGLNEGRSGQKIMEQALRDYLDKHRER